MKVVFNAPVVLTFTALAYAVLLASVLITPRITTDFCSTGGDFSPTSPLFYLTTITHVLGHANYQHFLANFMSILLVGPLLEEKNGSKRLLIMIVVTAAITGLINRVFFTTGVLGASGIVFMMLILASCVNFQRGQIPMTLLLAILVYLGQEFTRLGNEDNISRGSHILGGLCGAVFGLIWHPPRRVSATKQLAAVP